MCTSRKMLMLLPPPQTSNRLGVDAFLRVLETKQAEYSALIAILRGADRRLRAAASRAHSIDPRHTLPVINNRANAPHTVGIAGSSGGERPSALLHVPNAISNTNTNTDAIPQSARKESVGGGNGKDDAMMRLRTVISSRVHEKTSKAFKSMLY
eukprot:Opistho-2@59378